MLGLHLVLVKLHWQDNIIDDTIRLGMIEHLST
jgi:hypothetical protein